MLDLQQRQLTPPKGEKFPSFRERFGPYVSDLMGVEGNQRPKSHAQKIAESRSKKMAEKRARKRRDKR